MAWSEETFYTLVKRGIQNKDGNWIRADLFTQLSYPPSQIADFTISCTPLLILGSYADAYTNAYSEVIFEPKEVITGVPGIINGVAKVKFNKAANTTLCSIDLYDSNDVYIQGTPLDLPAGRPGAMYVGGSWLPDPICSCYVVLACQQDAVGNIIKAMFTVSEQMSVACKTVPDVPPGTNPGINIFKPWDFYTNVPSWPSMLGLLDAWCLGEYWDPVGNAGRPDPNPGMPDGGQGGYRLPEDDITVPSLPSLSAVDSGFVRIYEVSSAEMEALATELWSPGFYSSIIKNFQSPFENIISLGIIPYTGLTGSQEQIQIGNYAATAVGNKLATTMYQIDCGNVNVREYYNNWLDYDGYTNLDVVLPLCGTVSVSPSEFENGVMNIKYNFDIFSGAVIGFISAIKDGHERVLYYKEGSMRTEIPISGANYASVYSTMISSALGMATGIAIGRPDKAVGAAANLTQMKPQYQRSGSANGSQNILGIRTPYIIYHIPDCIQDQNYPYEHGFRSDKYNLISECEGFLQASVDMYDLEGIPCTDNEREMIKRALDQGIYIWR